MHAFIVKFRHGGRRIVANCRHRSGGEALAEICDALGITYPTHASILKVRS